MMMYKLIECEMADDDLDPEPHEICRVVSVGNFNAITAVENMLRYLKDKDTPAGDFSQGDEVDDEI